MPVIPVDGRPAPLISVVIPTYNRRAQLHQTLCGLAQQTRPGTFEVVVVSDGSTDGTDQYLRSHAVPLAVVALVQENGGPAAARNAGLLASRSSIVLFIDDDIIPEPDLVEQHLLAHQAAERDIVAIGPMLTPAGVSLSPWVAWEQHQLTKQYHALREGAFSCTFRQFYTGNASVPRQRVIDVGLFNTEFRRAEDLELAFRLHETGVHFEFLPLARAHHHAERSFESWLAAARDYGRNDVAFMAIGHEWLVSAMPADFRSRNPVVRTLTRICVPRPRLATAVTSGFARVAPSRLVPSPIGRRLLSGLFNVTYYLGVAEALGSPRRFSRWIVGSMDPRLRAAFVLEQVLGHVTHGANLERLVGAHDGPTAVFLRIPFDQDPRHAIIPGFGNWTIRAGIRARRAIRRQYRGHGIDVMFIHTQVPALLARAWMKRIATVVSLDGTPLQIDEMSVQYDHRTSSPRVERLKFEINRRCFLRAHELVAWSEWTRASLVRDYGIRPERVTVIAPGVDFSQWGERIDREVADQPVRVLFVGGSLERKGGLLLLEAARRLRADPNVPEFEVHLVTGTTVPDEPGIVIHNAMTPNSAALVELYQTCDIFCLPTLGDCLPLVLAEAAACSMALVSTDVGAISEIVRDGDTGILIKPGDLDSLEVALRRLLSDPVERRRLGAAAHELARKEHDASVNAGRIVDLLVSIGERAD